MSSSWKRFALAAIVVPIFALPTTLSTALGASPVLTKEFRSSSGKTVIQYYDYEAGPCGPGLQCDFLGAISVPPGYDQARVFVSGFRLETAKLADDVSQLFVRTRKTARYPDGNGEMEVSIGAGLETATPQEYSYHLSFVVVLTQAWAAKFTHTPIGGCRGAGSCTITSALPNAIPAPMRYIGVATDVLFLSTDGRPQTLGSLSGNADGTLARAPDVELNYACELANSNKDNKMFCEWSGDVVAFDPSEMEPNDPLNATSFEGKEYNDVKAFTGGFTNPSSNPLVGFFDGLEGLTLAVSNSGMFAVWLIDASAENFDVGGGVPGAAMTSYSIFLGSEFKNYTTGQKYDFKETRVLGFLH